MISARYYGEHDLRVESTERPTADRDEVLVDRRAASLCGSDVNYRKGKIEPATAPITLGNEGTGVVESVGSDVDAVNVGDRVVVHYIRSCGACRPCSRGNDNRCRNRRLIGHHVDGTFAEAIAVPERAVVPLPDDVKRSWLGHVLVREDEAAIREYESRIFPLPWGEESDMADAGLRDFEDAREKGQFLVGTPGEVTSQIEAILDLGSGKLQLMFLDFPETKGMELFGDEALQAFQ